jgi:two-component system, OmpR family, response regulator
MSLKHVFYVDDEADILEVAGMCLETVGGLQVTLCNDSAEAHDMILQAKPDLVLLDVMMPGMDGPTVLTHIQADPALADTPVIFMTARVQPEDIEKYMEMGVIGVIEKPFDPMNLSNKIIEFWNSRKTA